MSNETPPIVVKGNEALVDPAKLAVANVVVVIGALTALSGFVSNRDLAGFIVWIKTTDGAAFLAAALSLAGIVYSWWKSRHRAAQVVNVAADERVPAEVATVK
nr:hypothetical protein [uncultured Sphingomonas sp.]